MTFLGWRNFLLRSFFFLLLNWSVVTFFSEFEEIEMFETSSSSRNRLSLWFPSDFNVPPPIGWINRWEKMDKSRRIEKGENVYPFDQSFSSQRLDRKFDPKTPSSLTIFNFKNSTKNLKITNYHLRNMRPIFFKDQGFKFFLIFKRSPRKGWVGVFRLQRSRYSSPTSSGSRKVMVFSVSLFNDYLFKESLYLFFHSIYARIEFSELYQLSIIRLCVLLRISHFSIINWFLFVEKFLSNLADYRWYYNFFSAFSKLIPWVAMIRLITFCSFKISFIF